MDNQEIEDAKLDNGEEEVPEFFNGIRSLEHQVCKDEDCKHAGKRQPIGNFEVHGRSGKPIGYCKECMSKRKSLGRKKHNKRLAEKKDRQSAVTDALATLTTKKPLEEFAKQQKASQTAEIVPATLTIDFTDHPETLERICEIAKEFMREPEAQVLYWLTKLVKLDFNELQRQELERSG